jgi:SAM-dependent methyltransferase
MLYKLLRNLSPDQVVLDLGCGSGSFHYESCVCRVVGIDLSFDQHQPTRERLLRACADCHEIPLADGSVDAVVSNHNLEHVSNYKRALVEVARVLKPDGWFWITVPNGYSFEDNLYRWVFSGGGHVNRFRRDELIADVTNIASLKLVRSCDLFSGYVFLKRPTPEQARHYPRTARFLVDIPGGFLNFGVLSLQAGTRILDRFLGSRYSQYGWGFLFARNGIEAEQPLSFFNVCRNCGSGNLAADIRGYPPSVFGVKMYRCPHCSEVNLMVPPPRGLH